MGTRDEMKHAASLGIKAGAFSSYTSLAYRSCHAYTVRDRRGAVTETHTPGHRHPRHPPPLAPLRAGV